MPIVAKSSTACSELQSKRRPTTAFDMNKPKPLVSLPCDDERIEAPGGRTRTSPAQRALALASAAGCCSPPFLIDSHNAAVERRKERLLLDMRFLGRSLNLGSAYTVIADRSPHGAKFERIAYVDANHERAPEDAEFAETAAQNRGVNVRLFRTLTDARQWLEES